jgi:cation transport ATPase
MPHETSADEAQRKRLLLQSALALVAGMAAGPAVLTYLAQSGNLGGPAQAPYRSSAVLLACVVAVGWGVMRAWRSRRGAMDGLGLLALALAFIGVVSELTFALLLGMLWLGGSMLE